MSKNSEDKRKKVQGRTSRIIQLYVNWNEKTRKTSWTTFETRNDFSSIRDNINKCYLLNQFILIYFNINKYIKLAVQNNNKIIKYYFGYEKTKIKTNSLYYFRPGIEPFYWNLIWLLFLKHIWHYKFILSRIPSNLTSSHFRNLGNTLVTH